MILHAQNITTQFFLGKPINPLTSSSSVVIHLDRGRIKTIEENRAYVKAILECILYCCQQGLLLCGHKELIDTEDSSINTGNFRSLVVLQSRSNDIVRQRLTSGPKNASWLGHDMQNTLIQLQYIMSTLKELDVDINNCVSQCYDGASVMSGCQTGVRARISQINPSAIYIHCHAHQLNLVLVDACRKLPHASKFFSLLESLYAFISSSVPHSVFVTKQKELGHRVAELKQSSDTRWSCRYSSIKSELLCVLSYFVYNCI